MCGNNTNPGIYDLIFREKDITLVWLRSGCQGGSNHPGVRFGGLVTDNNLITRLTSDGLQVRARQARTTRLG